MNPSRFLQLIVRAQNIAPLTPGRVIVTWLTMMRWTETTHFLHLIVLSVKDRLHRNDGTAFNILWSAVDYWGR